MPRKKNHVRGGFSMIELTIVVVIIAIIAAIAIPKMSRGAAGANDSAVMQDLSTLRAGIDLYTTEHMGAAPTAASLVNQLTTYTDINGNTNSTKTSPYIYGPYVKTIPALPNLSGSANKGSSVISTTSPPGSGAAGGWYYDGTTIWVNELSTVVDANGKAYNGY